MSPVSQARSGTRAAQHAGRESAATRPPVPRADAEREKPARARSAPVKTPRAEPALKQTDRADPAPTTTAAHPAAEETS
ncbi:hypothetical protein [Streptomyces sp. NPDC002516]